MKDPQERATLDRVYAVIWNELLLSQASDVIEQIEKEFAKVSTEEMAA